MTLLHLISTTTWGDGERYALDVCRHFQSIGWRVLAFTRDANAIDLPFIRAGIKVRHLPLRGYSDLISAPRLAAWLRGMQGPVVIHVHKYKDAFTALLARRLARRRDVRVVLTRHLVKPARRSPLALRLYRSLDAQIFVSRLARDRFISSWQGKQLPFPPERLHVLHNSLNQEPLSYTSLPAKGPRIILFLGRLSPDKGIETILESLHVLRGRKARVHICGTGQADYIDSLKRLATRLGVMDLIDWKGHVADTGAAIRAAHIAVLPSVAEESFGLTNIEVMSCGRMQICTCHGAQPEYLTDGHDALFISPGDSEALASHLTALLDDSDSPSRIETMGRAALESYFSRLAWPRFAAELQKIYLASN